MMRIFNGREGIDRKHDALPEKFLKKPLEGGGPTDGWKLDPSEFEDALEAYYRQAGWDIASGLPTRQTLDRLGLSWVQEDYSHENGS